MNWHFITNQICCLAASFHCLIASLPGDAIVLPPGPTTAPPEVDKLLLSSTVNTNVSSDIDRIEYLTILMVKKEIDFERFYTKYHMLGTKDPKYRYTRYFLLQQAAAGLNLSSSVTSLAETGKNLRTPENVSTRTLKAAAKANVLASIFQGGSSAIELGSNSFTAVKHRLKKQDPASSKKEAIRRLKEIDEIASERNQLVQRNKDSQSFEVWSVEGSLLKSFRNWCLSEFINAYADVKSYQTSNNIYYVLDISSSSLYLASSLLALRGFREAKQYRPSAVTGIVGDGFGIVSAPSYWYSYNELYKYWMWRTARQFHEKLSDTDGPAKTLMAKLEQLVGSENVPSAAEVDRTNPGETPNAVPNTPPDTTPVPNAAPETASSVTPVLRAALIPGAVASRVRLYRLWSKRYERFVEKEAIDWRHSEKVALQSNIAGPLISGASLSQDVMAAVAAYRYPDNVRAQNNFYFAESIPTTVSNSVSLALSTYWFWDNKKHEASLRKQNALPEQLLEQRLNTLDELERILTTP